MSGIGLLLLLTAIFLPGWQTDGEAYLPNTAGQMTSVYLLPALALLLALRQGGIDWSVWSAAALGGVVAAEAILAGTRPIVAFVLAGLVGAGVGLANVTLVWARVPTVLGTAVTALVAMWVAQGLADAPAGETLAIPEQAFDHWGPSNETRPEAVLPSLPLLIVRMLVVASVYATVLVGMLLWDLRRGGQERPAAPGNAALSVALLVGGTISAVGGACWLLDYSQVPVPVRPVGDLRVLAAPLLAGALLLAGPGRSLLAGVCLPAGLLVATVWQQRVWYLSGLGYEWQVLLLALAAGLTQIALVVACPAIRRRRWARAGSAVLAVAGMAVLAASSYLMLSSMRPVLHAAGVGLLGAAAVWLAAGQAYRKGEGSDRSENG